LVPRAEIAERDYDLNIGNYLHGGEVAEGDLVSLFDAFSVSQTRRAESEIRLATVLDRLRSLGLVDGDD